MSEESSRFKTYMSIAVFLGMCTFAGGVTGFMHQTGVIDIFLAAASDDYDTQEYYSDRASRPVTQEEYDRNTKWGWRVGCSHAPNRCIRKSWYSEK